LAAAWNSSGVRSPLVRGFSHFVERQLFDSVAKGLAEDYEKLRKVGLDVGLKGSAAENVLTACQRIGLRNGTAI
jgi:hypothetical protein